MADQKMNNRVNIFREVNKEIFQCNCPFHLTILLYPRLEKLYRQITKQIKLVISKGDPLFAKPNIFKYLNNLRSQIQILKIFLNFRVTNTNS